MNASRWLPTTAPLAVLVLAGCPEPEPEPEPPSLDFDQAPEIAVEAGESVNLSVTWTGDPGEDRSLAWDATCGHVMGLERRGSYVAPDAAADCEVSATSLADPEWTATLRVVVTGAAGGGAVRWTRHVASNLDDAVRHVAPTPDGGLVALVETQGDLGGAPLGDIDIVVLRYDSAGALSWSRRLATESREFSGDVTVGPDGAIWVVGSTYGVLDVASAGEFDAFLARLDDDGEIAWIRQYGTDRTDHATGVAVGPGGDLWVAGWTEGGLDGANLGGPDGYLRRFDPDGEVVWTRQFGGSGIDFAIGVAADGEDAVVVGTTDGQVAAPSAGGLDWYLARIAGDGASVGLQQHGGATDDRAYGVAARPDGGVVVVGSLGPDAFVQAQDDAGVAAWTHAIATDGEDLGQAVAIAPDGDVVVSGASTGDVGTPNVGFFDAFVVRLGEEGGLVWTRRIGSAADDYGWAVAWTSDGDVVVGGRTDGVLADGFGWGGDGFLRRLGP